MHGNNGSIDGDGAAAMRYTECRMSRYGQALITDIKKNCVKFIDNFDGSEQEPTLLPTLLPNLLINGSTGIAAGYATNIPPFNPKEVLEALITRIDSPNCRLETISKIMPAPDFPTGGIILEAENMKQVYETGRGKIVLRAKMELKNSKTAYITEIPFEINKSSLLREIHELIVENKALGITSVVDESDEKGISIAINLKDPKK
jgi:topoisomerase-4 subunit A